MLWIKKGLRWYNRRLKRSELRTWGNPQNSYENKETNTASLPDWKTVVVWIVYEVAHVWPSGNKLHLWYGGKFTESFLVTIGRLCKAQVALEDKTAYLCQKAVIRMKNQVRPVCSPKDKIWSRPDKLKDAVDYLWSRPNWDKSWKTKARVFWFGNDLTGDM